MVCPESVLSGGLAGRTGDSLVGEGLAGQLPVQGEEGQRVGSVGIQVVQLDLRRLPSYSHLQGRTRSWLNTWAGKRGREGGGGTEGGREGGSGRGKSFFLSLPSPAQRERFLEWVVDDESAPIRTRWVLTLHEQNHDASLAASLAALPSPLCIVAGFPLFFFSVCVSVFFSSVSAHSFLWGTLAALYNVVKVDDICILSGSC